MKKYICFDTGETWTEAEIQEEYNANPDLIANYPSFADYLESLLALGRQKSGGIVEA